MSYTQNQDIFSTGMLERIALTINADNTKFDIADTGINPAGILVDRSSNLLSPRIIPIRWSGLTAITVPDIATAAGTWVGIDPSPLLSGNPITTTNVIRQVTDFSKSQLDTYLRLGRLSHFGNTVVTGTFNYPKFYDLTNDFASKQMVLGTQKIDPVNGGKISANNPSTTLEIDFADILTFRVGAGLSTDINKPFVNAESQITMLLSHTTPASQRTTIASSGTSVDTNNYDNAGTLTALNNNQWGNSYFYFFPNPTGTPTYTMFLLYANRTSGGEGIPAGGYPNSAAAIAALGTDLVIREDIAGGIVLGAITYEKGVTNLSTAIITQSTLTGEF